MTLRSLIDIKSEQNECFEKIRKLNEELDKIRTECPHPINFVERTTVDVDYDNYGTGGYDYTWASCECKLCGRKGSKEFDKKSENIPSVKEVFENK